MEQNLFVMKNELSLEKFESYFFLPNGQVHFV